MTAKKKKLELWTLVSLVLLAAFLLFLVYPMFGLLKQAVITPEGKFSLQEFVKFFSKSYYTSTIINSVKVTLSVVQTPPAALPTPVLTKVSGDAVWSL